MTAELTLRVTDLERKAIAFCCEKDVPYPIANYLVEFAEEITKELKGQIEKTLNEVDKCMCLSNMKEREIYDIQEIFRQNGFKRNDVDKWELVE